MKISLLTGFIAGVGVSVAIHNSKLLKIIKSERGKMVAKETFEEIID